jgi:hypothetical protein
MAINPMNPLANASDASRSEQIIRQLAYRNAKRPFSALSKRQFRANLPNKIRHNIRIGRGPRAGRRPGYTR